MANYLQDLAFGLRSAAGVLNPDIQRQTFAADEREKQVVEQRRNLAAQQIIRAAEMGAIQPEVAKAQLQRLGFGEMPVGPDAATQARTEEIRRRREYEEAAKSAGGDLAKLAPIAAAYKPELGASMYNALSAREQRAEAAMMVLEQRREAAQQRHEFNMQRLTNERDRLAETQRHNSIMEQFRQEGLALRRTLGGGGGRPLTDVAKLNADRDAGRITQEQYDAEIGARKSSKPQMTDAELADVIRTEADKLKTIIKNNPKSAASLLSGASRGIEAVWGLADESYSGPALEANAAKQRLINAADQLVKQGRSSNEFLRRLESGLGMGSVTTPGNAQKAIDEWVDLANRLSPSKPGAPRTNTPKPGTVLKFDAQGNPVK